MPLLTDIRKTFFVLYPSPDVGWSNVWTIIYCVCNWDSVSRMIGVVQVRSEEESRNIGSSEGKQNVEGGDSSESMLMLSVFRNEYFMY